MSPSTLRRYRAERLLRQEFGGLREEVLGSVRGRLRARGVHLDGGDLEACYAQAWQGLYTAIAEGEEIANPGGWLAVVTFRRAIDEHRGARARERATSERAAIEPDFAAELDDRTRLRQLFEALRSRLSARECEAAALCYLQGLTRAQAAQRMGIGEGQMVKLMEGRGPGRPGVAGKVGELLGAIRGGQWCEQQGSSMRALAFGVLDPNGERYRLALLHQRECPACRAYILSLRGLAAVLPPLPLPWALGFGAPSPHTAGVGAGTGTGTASTGVGTGVASAGTISATGAAGVGGASGGWLLAGGSVGAKLAVSCLLALTVGCVALTVAPHHTETSSHRHRSAGAPPARSTYLAAVSAMTAGSTSLGGALQARSSSAAADPIARSGRAAAEHRAATRQAQREFGPERPAAGATSAVLRGQPRAVRARAASVLRQALGRSAVTPASQGGAPSHAEREFGPE